MLFNSVAEVIIELPGGRLFMNTFMQYNVTRAVSAMALVGGVFLSMPSQAAIALIAPGYSTAASNQ